MMKHIFSFILLGTSALVLTCCSDDAPSPVSSVPVADISASSTSTAPGLSSAATGSQPKNLSSSTIVVGKRDTTTKHETVTVPGSDVPYPDIYDKPVFCFTEGCEKTVKPPSSSSKATKTSSSSKNSIVIDEPENKAPTINGMSMTDMRDNKTYQLMQIGGKLWMAQDINYQVANSECYNEKDANCSTNGRLYTFNAAQKACPLGWHLPTRNEAQAALSDESVPWSYSGRCKDGTCDFLGDMGFHWTSATPQSGDKNFDTNTGDSYTVIIVEKSPDYVKEEDNPKFFQVDSKTKRFSVRCVQN